MSNEYHDYKQNGFYIARSLLQASDVIKVRDNLAKVFHDQLKYLSIESHNKHIFEAMKMLHDADIERYKKIIASLWRKYEVFELSHNKKIVQFLSKIFGWNDFFMPGGQVVHIMADELKIPGGYFGLIPHQDYPSVQGSIGGVVVWIPLVDIDTNNFPLEVIPGSHKLGVLPTYENNSSTWEIKSEQIDENDFVPVEVNVGDVVFMSYFTVHRSSQEGLNGMFRLAVSTRYDNADEVSFIERCYPTAYERNIHREQYIKNFPTTEQVKDIFV